MISEKKSFFTINSSYFQIAVIVITIFLLSALFYFPLTKFNAKDVKPHFLPLYPKKGETVYQAQATIVNVGLFIQDFPTFDILKNNFIIDGVLWFEFDPQAVSLETIDNFSFEKGTILSKSQAQTKIIDGKLFAGYNVRVQLESNLDFKLFPLDDHYIYLTLTNKSTTPTEVIFSSQKNNFSIYKDLYIHNWTYLENNVDTGYYISSLQKYDTQKVSSHPCVIFTLNFKKSGVKKVFIIFVPIIIAFFLSMFSLIINVRNYSTVLSLAIGSITTSVFNLMSVQSQTPNTGYFTISDSVYTLLFIISFAVLLINIFFIRPAIKLEPLLSKSDEIALAKLNKINFIRNQLFILFSTLIIIFVYIILYS